MIPLIGSASWFKLTSPTRPLPAGGARAGRSSAARPAPPPGTSPRRAPPLATPCASRETWGAARPSARQRWRTGQFSGKGWPAEGSLRPPGRYPCCPSHLGPWSRPLLLTPSWAVTRGRLYDRLHRCWNEPVERRSCRRQMGWVTQVSWTFREPANRRREEHWVTYALELMST